jgi:hypothetical protein
MVLKLEGVACGKKSIGYKDTDEEKRERDSQDNS